MSPISSPSRRSPARRLVFLAVASALAAGALPAFAAAETAGDTDAIAMADAGTDAGGARPTRLDGVEVEGERVERPANVKYTEPLRDTPQTITVVNRATLEEQNLLSLRDILSTLPGITFGAGEGGGGYGDSINLRGFSANADITVDGVRDSAQYNRTDSFNLESLELVNGANSVYSGAGSVGGNINLVSKAAGLDEFNLVTLGAGTDGYGRATADSNLLLNDRTALRLNAMVHRNDAPGRDVETFERWGFAPSIGFNLDGATRFTLSAVVQHDDNIPQYGVPYFAAYGGLLPGADIEAYYGYRNMDRQEIDNHSITGIFAHDFSDQLSIRNLTRFQKVEQFTLVNPTQGTWCLASNINPATGLACTGGQAPGTFIPSGPRGTTRDTTNDLAINQTDLTANFRTGGVEHDLVVGVAFSHETFDLDNGNTQRNADGSVPVYPPMQIGDPDNVYTGPVNYIRAGRNHGTLDNQAVYAFDTMKFGEQWQLNLGARWEHNDGTSRVSTYAPSGAVLTDLEFPNEEDLFSWRAGVVFKPTEAGSIYFSYSDSVTPSKASVNGACSAVTCNVDPETSSNWELGTKWDLIEGRLAFTAALFRNDRENYKVASPDPLALGEQTLDGSARVDGISLGVSGQVTRNWSVFANATFLDSEIRQGVSDYCLAHPGATYTPPGGSAITCANSVADPDPERGMEILATPETAVGLWTTYQVNDWTFGYGVNYQSDFRVGLDLYTDDWITHRAMIAWKVNDMLSLQLNGNNLFDEEYFTRVRNNGWATPGDARSFTLTANLTF